MDNILNNLKQEFKQGTILNKLIYLNVGVFLLFSIFGVFSFMFQFNLSPVLDQLYLPAENNRLLSQPWAFITYMFLHNDFLHLLFNMVWLYLAGKLFLKFLHSRQLLITYILGGITGGLFFILAYNYIPVFKPFLINALIVGSSASVYAIMIAIATYSPNYEIYLNFNKTKKIRWIIALAAFFLQAIFLSFGNGVGMFGELPPLMCGIIGFYIGTLERSPKIKYIILILIILDFISIPIGNPGGHIAHLGGALFGYLYIKQLQKGNDFSIGFTKWINNISNLFKPKSKLKTVHKRKKTDTQFNTEKSAQQIAVDIVLEKISKSGYESLSKEEKATLFSASKK